MSPRAGETGGHHVPRAGVGGADSPPTKTSRTFLQAPSRGG